MKQTKYKWFLILFILLILNGCDRKEIENRAYVIGLGIDKGPGDMFQITYVIANPEYGSEALGGPSDVPPRELITMNANDFISLKNRANAVVAKQITYDQLQMIAVSEELAQEKSFINFMYDATKDVEIRRDVKLMVTKESASQYFKQNHPRLQARAHEYFNLMMDRGAETGLIPSNSELMRYFRITEAGSDLFLAIYTTSEKNEEHLPNETNQIKAGELNYSGETNKTQFAGAAVFKDGKMIGTLTGQEVRYTVLLNNTMSLKDDLASVPDPFNEGKQMTVKVNQLYKNEIHMSLDEDSPRIDVTVPLTLEILTDRTITDFSNKKNRDFLEKKLTEIMESHLQAFVEKTQKEFKAQPFGWSLEARKNFRTLAAYEKYQFKKKFADMDVHVKVKLTISDYGRQKNVPKENIKEE